MEEVCEVTIRWDEAVEKDWGDDILNTSGDQTVFVFDLLLVFISWKTDKESERILII